MHKYQTMLKYESVMEGMHSSESDTPTVWSLSPGLLDLQEQTEKQLGLFTFKMWVQY